MTGAGARTDVMHWRRYFPAILVSAMALADDPSLTSRIGYEVWWRFGLDRPFSLLPQKGQPIAERSVCRKYHACL